MKIRDLSKPLYEDAESDHRYGAIANEIVGKIIKFFGEFTKKDEDEIDRIEPFGLERIVLRMPTGKNLPALLLRPEQADITGIGDDIAFCFGRDPSRGGFAMHNYPLENFKHIVFVSSGDVMEPWTIARNVVYNNDTHAVLHHEIIHCLDRKRFGNEYGAGEVSQKIADKTTKDKEKAVSDYFNNPVEFNAYYHNVAQILVKFITDARNEPEMISYRAKIYGINDTFPKMLEKLLKRSPMMAKDFMKHINQRNHRRLYKRLYQLYATARKLYDERDQSMQFEF